MVIKITLACTVRNESDNIKSFLDSILSQTRLPDEIIIVDGGSTDGTIQIISQRMLTAKTIRLIVKDGANISEGRNIAIDKAQFEYIASADAGTKYEKEWLYHLSRVIETEPNRETDVVCGFFLPDAGNMYEECVGKLLYPKHNMVKWGEFIPSNRSVLFKKKCWQEMGGYPEWLPYGIGEDSYFFSKARKLGYKFDYAKDAICHWRPRKNIIKLFKQYYYYAKGSTVGGIGTMFLTKAYGRNPISFTLSNFKQLIKEKKYFHIGLGIIILGTVGVAKICGTISGSMWGGGK